MRSIEQVQKEFDAAYIRVNELMQRWDIWTRMKKKSYLRAKAREDKLAKELTKMRVESWRKQQ